ncbi:hypothetical protein PtrSN002B_007955 [Pyrenophora tritici-repentis]|uniref:DUF1777 multi-domain protein n=2 Tax=Pyrenophora tritici-repentis TaxID=45151 RepID=A0A2W1GTM7_9PLEO|nr:uncharacterized protein PTRG_09796 [Pyrenophora tritici-repentis Pt-1C-BFP]KAA8621834.1 hypothetical protein PtrV1_06335 [Pyrenophora tritici-repentis]EDU42847.1 predicted protein [Pyrenophora tritici-repentis Pt-1C-BFP]KAF7451055.1 hypothetical protein A1F99_056710 [Pyrenophora tritici-repentis]KAF7573735.1 DUF1777 multi-domain protein [Pyrenophora tritici-repentis]KAG9380730.1 hypothetical protein A1F94_008050 [Pyrenophora tritici-repentis]
MGDTSSEAETLSPANRAQQVLAKAAQSLHRRRAAPPRLPLPISFTRTSTPPPTPLPVEEAMKWVTIELSNYPTQFTHQDVLDLFQDFTISPEFTLPNAVNFTHPLRTFIKIAGQEEAKRAVHEMRWRLFGGRAISVKMAEDTGHEEVNQTAEEVIDETDHEDVNHTAGEVVDETGHQEFEQPAEEVVEETGHEGDKQKNEKLAVQQKIEIINIARAYYPHLASKVLEIREHVQGYDTFAFLQARDLIPVHGESDANMEPGENVVKWELVASGRSSGFSWKMEEGTDILSALKWLRDVLVTQGTMARVWGELEGADVRPDV